MPDCQRFTLTVEAFRVVREDYAEDDVPDWAWGKVASAQNWFPTVAAIGNTPKDRIGCWLIRLPFPVFGTYFHSSIWVSDADFRANFRPVEVLGPHAQEWLGWKTAMNGWEKPGPTEGLSEQEKADYLRGWEAGRAELEARR